MRDFWVTTVHLRRLLARRVMRRALAVVVGVATLCTVVAVLRTAEEARGRWGESRQVAVALRDLSPGDTVDPSNVELRRLPTVAVPESALSELPTGAVVHAAVASGEALVDVRLAPEDVSGVAAVLPEGHVAVAVPIGAAGLPPVSVGDHVDLLAVLASGDHGSEPAHPIAEDALVVDVDEKAVSVAVDGSHTASRVAFAVAHGVVVLALRSASWQAEARYPDLSFPRSGEGEEEGER